MDFPQSSFFKCTTFKNSLRYLQKRKNIYYFCIKINNKTVKYSLKSGNLEYCKYLRNKIIKKIIERQKMNYKDMFNINSNYTITETILTKIEVNPDPNDPNQTEEKAEEIAKKLMALKLKETPNIKNIQNVDDIAINYNNIENYFEEYLKHKMEIEKVSISSKKSYISSFKYLMFLSNNETVYNFNFFKEFQKNLLLIPSNMTKFKKYDAKNIDELKEIHKKDKYETLSNKTINQHIVNVSNFFEYLVYNEIIEINHCKKIKKLIIEESTKTAYTEKDLIKIFSSELEEKYKEICKIALYTGARIQELTNIKKEDIDIQERIIKINGTKTKNAIRIIPIHLNIIETIKERLKKNNQFLFFEDNNSSRIGKLINNRLNKIITEKDKTFHSFRKNFSQKINETEAEEQIRKYLMGHSLNNDITHKIYNENKINMKKLFDCIDSIEYDLKWENKHKIMIDFF